MTALTLERFAGTERWKHQLFTLKSGTKAFKGAELVLDAGFVQPATSTSGGRVIGRALQTVDATSVAKPINVDLQEEIEITWLENSGTNAIVSTDVGSYCFHEDDQTVGIRSTGSLAGRIWAVSSTRGVGVQKVRDGAPRRFIGATQAFVANDLVLPNNPVPETVYDVPTTAGVSTITLPATAREGTAIYFSADGTKNGHTIQYRDATGPVNLTTALLASKRHLAVCLFLGGKWVVNAYVAP